MAKKVVEATINGEQTEFLCEPRQSLLEVLRDVVELTGSKEIEIQFRRELMLSRQIAHRNVCKIFDLGRHVEQGEPDMLFLTMEFLSGETLAERLKKGADGRVRYGEMTRQTHGLVATTGLSGSN